MPRATAAALALLLVGCAEATQPERVVEEVSVGPVAECGGLLHELQSQAAREMNAQIDELIESLEDGGMGLGRTDVATPTAVPAPSPAPGGGAGEYTQTNTREKDVDEPDFVKNDGSRIFALHGHHLLTIAAWPPEAAGVADDTRLGGDPISMLLHQDRLVVLSGVRLPQFSGGEDGSWRDPMGMIVPASSNAIRVEVRDVSSSAPRLLAVQYLEGSFLAARRTGASVRILSRAQGRGPKLRYWPEGDASSRAPGALRAALERLRAENLRRIKASPLAAWLPRILRPDTAGELVEVERECSSYVASNVPSRTGFTTISTLDLDNLTTRHRTLLTPADEAYASARALYLTARHQWLSPLLPPGGREAHTYLFQFDLASDRTDVRFVAAGGVPGYVSDPFSLDEDAGYLRVATTRVGGWPQTRSANDVYVLQASGSRLLRVGELVGLAPGERLYAARFEGARGYLVTFRVVDPLFTLDFATPSAPRLAGELHVPGFSTYLHPLDAGHLLTIGRDVTEDGVFRRGLQLQIFDVVNLANPGLLHRYLLGSRSSSSEAEYEHKAFNYFPARGLLAIPFSDWSPSRRDRFTSTLELLQASVERGITPVGSIDHAELLQGAGPPLPGWSPQVRRSVMMDDFVYSISCGGMMVHDARNLTRPVRVIPFPALD